MFALEMKMKSQPSLFLWSYSPWLKLKHHFHFFSYLHNRTRQQSIKLNFFLLLIPVVFDQQQYGCPLFQNLEHSISVYYIENSLHVSQSMTFEAGSICWWQLCKRGSLSATNEALLNYKRENSIFISRHQSLQFSWTSSHYLPEA